MKKVNKNLSPDSKNNVRNIESGLKKQAFTLVELIVVITILAILGTIAFMSFQGYSRDARDSVRISDLSNIHKQLELMLVKAGTVYMPENKVDITASGTIILYQGEMGQDTLNKLKVNNGGLDPLDKTPYIYSTSKNLKQYELMGFLENGNKVSYQVPSKSPHPNPLPEGEGIASIFPQANAANYLNRFPKVMGDELGILLDSTTNEPIQSTGTGVDIVNTNTNLKIYLDNSSSGSIIGTGANLYSKLYNKNIQLLKDKNLAKFDNSLVLYFDMETKTSTGGWTVMKDLSQYGNYGYCYGGGTNVNCGSSNGPQFINSNGKASMHFFGRSDSNLYDQDYIYSNDSSSLDISTNEFTISVWYKMDKNLSDMVYEWPALVYKRPNHIGGYMAHLTKTNERLSISYSFVSGYGYTTVDNSDIGIQPNKWYFYTGVKTQNKLLLYNNGELALSGINNNIMGSSTGVQLIIGSDFEGELSNVRIYNRALSDAEIKTLYNSSK